MTVKELQEELSRINQEGHLDDHQVIVKLRGSGNQLGPCPAANIDGLTVGIDWNSGQVLLHPNQELQLN